MYGIAYWGGRPLIERFGGRFGFAWGDVERLHRMFGKGYADEVVLIFMRAIPIFPISVVSVLCGIMRIRPVVFSLTTLIGSFVRIGSMSLIGWYVGKGYAQLAGHLAVFERYGVLLLFALLAFLVVHSLRRRSS